MTWSLRELWLEQYLPGEEGSILLPIFSAIIKLIIWVLPVFVYIQWIDKKQPLFYLGLRTAIGKGVKWGVLGTIGFFLYFLITHPNGFDFHLSFDTWLNGVILVGFTEEVVFRGFLLTKFMRVFTFWKANTMTSLLFVFIHFPVWILEGSMEFPQIFNHVIQIFLLSVLFGFVYKKSRSLWAAIIVHSVYDLFVEMFH